MMNPKKVHFLDSLFAKSVVFISLFLFSANDLLASELDHVLSGWEWVLYMIGGLLIAVIISLFFIKTEKGLIIFSCINWGVFLLFASFLSGLGGIIMFFFIVFAVLQLIGFLVFHFRKKKKENQA